MSKYAIIKIELFNDEMLKESNYPVVCEVNGFKMLEYKEQPDPNGDWLIFDSANDCQEFMSKQKILTPEERREKVEELVAAAEAFGLGEFIQKFFFKHRNIIQDYILNGGPALYELFLKENSSDVELDFTNDDGLSPREYAKGLLKPKG